MFSFAALVIHSYVTIASFPGHSLKLMSSLTPLPFSVFRTSHDHGNINETSSYVDLAPLYGVDQDSQNQVRVRNGRGLLHPDVFAEDRLLLLPPAVCVLLVLFNRNHNVRCPLAPTPLSPLLFHIPHAFSISPRSSWRSMSAEPGITQTPSQQTPKIAPRSSWTRKRKSSKSRDRSTAAGLVSSSSLTIFPPFLAWSGKATTGA